MSSTLLLREEIYPRKSFTNLYQLMLHAYLTIIRGFPHCVEFYNQLMIWKI